MGKGIWYYKTDLSMLGDEKIEDVIDEYGAYGLGVWTACLIHVYSYGNEDRGPIPTDRLVRKVARDLGEEPSRIQEVVEYFAKVGLFNNEVFNKGRCANDRASEEILRHQQKVRIGRENVSKRWEKAS